MKSAAPTPTMMTSTFVTVREAVAGLVAGFSAVKAGKKNPARSKEPAVMSMPLRQQTAA